MVGLFQRARVRLTVGGLTLVVLGCLPYLGTLDHPLLRDDRTLLDNAWLQDEANAGNVFAHHYWHGTRHEQSDLYRPLTILSLAWNARWKMSAASFRTVNVGLHALCGAIAAWTLLLLFRRAGIERAGLAAWSGAALFVVHPLASEAVLFAVGRADVLSLALSLLAFAILVGGSGGVARVAVSALVFLAALFFKESAACWPLVLLGWAWVERRRALAGFAAWSAMLALFVVIRGSVIGWDLKMPPWVDNPLVLESSVTRIANALLIFVRYLGKIVWPAKLSVEYGYDQVRVLSLLPWALPGALAMLGGWTAVAWWLRRASPAPALWLWVFVPLTFAVTGNVGFPIGVIFAERLAYPALLGACGLAGLLLTLRLPRKSGVVVAIVAALALLAGARTVERGRDLAGHRALVEATAEASPRAVKALVNHGRSLLRSGQARDALARFERAIEIWPGYPRALALAGDAWEVLGDPARAEEYRERARSAYREYRPETDARIR